MNPRKYRVEKGKGNTALQRWLEMTLTSNRDLLPHLSALLMSRQIRTWVEEEQGDSVKLKIYIPYFEGVRDYLDSIKKLFDVEDVRVVVKEIKDENWSTSWQRFFDVRRVGERIVLKPPWRDYEPKNGDIVLEIEPKSAFGTGYHPTTAGTLILMEKYISPGMKVLDMGCGSGILSIAAARLGAGSILGVDNDPNCIRESRQNYREALQKHTHMTPRSTFKISDAFSGVEGKFDTVVINVNTGFIMQHLESVSEHTRQGGFFISGSVIDEKLTSMRKKLRALGMELVEKQEYQNWLGVVFKKIR